MKGTLQIMSYSMGPISRATDKENRVLCVLWQADCVAFQQPELLSQGFLEMSKA